jgi:hypothetical protein
MTPDLLSRLTGIVIAFCVLMFFVAFLEADGRLAIERLGAYLKGLRHVRLRVSFRNHLRPATPRDFLPTDASARRYLDAVVRVGRPAIEMPDVSSHLDWLALEHRKN